MRGFFGGKKLSKKQQQEEEDAKIAPNRRTEGE
jgi:hypothetical protein